ncbi:MAG: WD40 repeat domain-containing protein [Chloroflexota bacterium]|nr:WD40 repeat domain-containing protein [Chloroflexota bacterium]
MLRIVFRLVISVLLSAFIVASASAQATPAQVNTAVSALGTSLGRPLTLGDMTNWRFRIELWQDSGLGCPGVLGASLSAPVNVYIVTLDYQGASYEYRTTETGSSGFFCGATFAPSATPPPVVPTFPPAPGQPTLVAPLDPNLVTGQTCPPGFAGFLQPRLQVGTSARIEPGGTPNRLRAAPNVNALQVGIINPGGTAAVLGGPSCDAVSQIIWWQVRFNNQLGWTAEGVLPDEYFVEPVGIVATSTPFLGRSAAPLPEERSLITRAAISDPVALRELSRIPVPGVAAFAFAPDSSLVVIATFGGAPLTYQLPEVVRDPLVFTGVPEGVNALAFSPDGQSIAFGTFRGQVSIFNLQTETAIELPSVPDGQPINALALSANGLIAVSYGQGFFGGVVAPGVAVYDVAARTIRYILPSDATFGAAVAFNAAADSLVIADSALRVYDSATGQLVLEAGALEAPVFNALALVQRADGTQRTAYTDGGSVAVFNDGLSDLVSLTLPGVAQRGLFATRVAFAPSGDLIAAASAPGEGSPAQGGEVTLFDPTADFSLISLPVLASGLAFSPDGTLLALATGEALIVYGV